jgi:hypothetical protein
MSFPARLFVCHPVYLSVCLSSSLSSSPIFLLQSLLPVLSVAVQPNSTVCLPARLPVCLSFVRLFACCCSAYLYFCLPSCLSDLLLTTLVCLPVILYVRLLVCLSFCQPVVCSHLSLTVSPSCLVCCCPA